MPGNDIIAYRLGGALTGAGAAVFLSFGCFFFSLSFGLLSPIRIFPFRKVHGAVAQNPPERVGARRPARA